MTLSSQTMNHQDATEWVEGKAWTNGWQVSPDKSVNHVEFANQYLRNKVLWDVMFAFLSSNDLENLDLGEHQIEPGRCWVTISEYIPKSTDEGNIESHRKFIDLQYVLRGNEKMGLAGNVTVRKKYNQERDVAFWNSNDITYYPATSDVFFLFFPSDIHQPSVRTDSDMMRRRKIVVKIEYID